MKIKSPNKLGVSIGIGSRDAAFEAPKYLEVAAVYILIVLAMISATLPTVALSAIAEKLDLVALGNSWVITSYGTGMVVGFVLAPITRRVLGFYVNFLISLITFFAVHVIIAAFPSVQVIFMGHFIQGVAGAYLIFGSKQLLFMVLMFENKSNAIAVLASALSLGPVIGFMAGTPLIELIGWRVLYVVVGILPLLCPLFLGRCVRQNGDLYSPDEIFRKKEILPLLSFLGVVICLQIMVEVFSVFQRITPGMVLFAVLAFSHLVILVVSSRGTQLAELFGNSCWRVGTGILAVGTACVFSLVSILPSWLIQVTAWESWKIALLTATTSLASAVAAPFLGGYVKPSNHATGIILILMLNSLGALSLGLTVLIGDDIFLFLSRIISGLALALMIIWLLDWSLSTISSNLVVDGSSLSMCLRLMVTNIITAIVFFVFSLMKKILDECSEVLWVCSERSGVSRLLAISTSDHVSLAAVSFLISIVFILCALFVYAHKSAYFLSR